MSVVGERLRISRERKNLSQTEVFRRTKASGKPINNKTLSRYEAGGTEPDGETLTQLAELYEVSLDYLHGRVDQPQGVFTAAESELTDEVLELSDEELLENYKFTWKGKRISPDSEQKLRLFIQMLRLDEERRRAK